MKIKNLEPTPNPNAFKFNVDVTLTRRPMSFDNKESSQEDPIASSLFEVEGVESVFYLQDFITVSKTEDAEWESVMTSVGQKILEMESPELPEEAEEESSSLADRFAESDEERELLDKVEVIFDQMVRPALAGDGGGLDLLGYKDQKLYIRYQGACGTCPSAVSGTLAAIERLIRHQLADDEISVIAA